MKRSIVLLASGLLATPVAFGDVSYSYLQGFYTTAYVDFADGERDDSGPEINASYELMDFFHVHGGYQSIEFSELDLDTEVLSLGAGVNHDFSDRQSVFFNLAVVEADVAVGSVSADADGYSYSLGYRERGRNDRIEFTISADHIEFDEDDVGDSGNTDTSITTGLQFRITPRLHIDTAVNFAGDDQYAKIGVRYYLPSWVERRQRAAQ